MLTVSYGDDSNGHHVVTESHQLQPGEEFVFHEHSYDEGSWLSVAGVHDVIARCISNGHAGPTVSITAHPSAGVEGAHGVHVHCSGGGGPEMEM